MITIKTDEEIETLREGGRRLASILKAVSEKIEPGVSAKDLDQLAFDLAKEGGDKPAFLNYQPYGAKTPFPASMCISVNDEVVHGIPNGHPPKILKDGDIVTIDMGLIHKGLVTDSAITLLVGEVDEKGRKLVEATKEALYRGIKAAEAGETVGNIGFAVESFVKPLGYGLAEGLAGHGVGYKVHEDPYVPNSGKKGEGPRLRPGMVIAIEPMLNEGGEKISLEDDGYTIRTADGGRSAHFEHTIAITEEGPKILTKLG